MLFSSPWIFFVSFFEPSCPPWSVDTSVAFKHYISTGRIAGLLVQILSGQVFTQFLSDQKCLFQEKINPTASPIEMALWRVSWGRMNPCTFTLLIKATAQFSSIPVCIPPLTSSLQAESVICAGLHCFSWTWSKPHLLTVSRPGKLSFFYQPHAMGPASPTPPGSLWECQSACAGTYLGMNSNSTNMCHCYLSSGQYTHLQVRACGDAPI